MYTPCSFRVKAIRPILVSILLLGCLPAQAELAIIVHPSNTAEITLEDIRHIFLGKDNNFSNNQRAVPIEAAAGKSRAEFLRKYLRKTETNLQHYWSIKTFTGKGHPPIQFDSDTEIRKQVAANPAMIGFIDTSNVDDTIKVVMVK